MQRWRGWWRFANIEQLTTFVAITFITIFFTSLLAYATVYGLPDLPNNINFIKVEGEVLGERVGSWFSTCSGPWGRSRCSLQRWASSTTPAAWPPT